MPFFDLIIRWVESSDFGPKSDDLGHRILKTDFIPSDFATSLCISRPIIFSDRKIKIRSSESDRVRNSLRAIQDDGKPTFELLRYCSIVVQLRSHGAIIASSFPRCCSHGHNIRVCVLSMRVCAHVCVCARVCACVCSHLEELLLMRFLCDSIDTYM